MKTILLFIGIAVALTACSSGEEKFIGRIGTSPSESVASATITINGDQGYLDVTFPPGSVSAPIHENLAVKKVIHDYEIRFTSGGPSVLLHQELITSKVYLCADCIHYGKNQILPVEWVNK